MITCPITVSQTSSSGAWSFNTVKFASAKLTHIVVKAATATTTFGLKITDDKDNVVYDTDTKPTGTLRECVLIPLKGIYTVAVYSASADEAFTGRLMVEE